MISELFEDFTSRTIDCIVEVLDSGKVLDEAFRVPGEEVAGVVVEELGEVVERKGGAEAVATEAEGSRLRGSSWKIQARSWRIWLREKGSQELDETLAMWWRRP